VRSVIVSFCLEGDWYKHVCSGTGVSPLAMAVILLLLKNAVASHRLNKINATTLQVNQESKNAQNYCSV
jgi:hypothetical protein